MLNKGCDGGSNVVAAFFEMSQIKHFYLFLLQHGKEPLKITLGAELTNKLTFSVQRSRNGCSLVEWSVTGEREGGTWGAREKEKKGTPTFSSSYR
jgi:hypothetical protein